MISRAVQLVAAGSGLLSSLEEAEAEADKVGQNLMLVDSRICCFSTLVNAVARVSTGC